MKTKNGANMKYSTGNPLVEFFSKAGSLMKKTKSFYGQGSEATALDLFYNAWAMDRVKAFKLALWLRDARSGAGNRSASREIFNFMAEQAPEWVELNFDLIPQYGRWDDLSCFVGTSLEDAAIAYWSTAILNKDGLANKWAPRENKKDKSVAKLLRTKMGFSPKEYRQHLSANTSVVETQMCSNNWNEISYSGVPSLAMARYGKAFKTKDATRFSSFLEKVADPDSSEKINATTLFPHDVYRTYKAGQTGVANAQFKALPDFFETGMRVMPIVDTSGSMVTMVSGSISAMDIAISLAMYCSDRLGSENPFYKKFIPFSGEATFVDWKAQPDFSSGVNFFRQSPWFGKICSTNINSAFKLLLDTASFLNVTSEQMPNVIIIISDMQFNQGCSASNKTEVQALLEVWASMGYEVPKVLYWNTAGYAGSPDDVFSPNIGLVSGFSPSILSSVFGSEEFTPEAIMNKALERYEVKMIL